ncbi:MAG: signal peptidase I [Nanoarchaeota archaeon]
MLKKLIIILIAFLCGALATSLYAGYSQGNLAYPLGTVFDTVEKNSPGDWINEDQVYIYDSRVVINVKDAKWAAFSDTNSMDPVLDMGANAIEIIPKSEDEIAVGDIISYTSSFQEGSIIHRVIEKGTDSQGTYFILKGDNNPSPDPEKVRFSQVRRVLVAIIY